MDENEHNAMSREITVPRVHVIIGAAQRFGTPLARFNASSSTKFE